MYGEINIHTGETIFEIGKGVKQKSMDDDNPTIPVNRGAAGIYIPEPNEKERAKKDMMSAIRRYLKVSNCDMDVLTIGIRDKAYEVRIARKR